MKETIKELDMQERIELLKLDLLLLELEASVGLMDGIKL